MWIDSNLDEASALTEWLRQNEAADRTIQRMAEVATSCLRAGGRILTCGNGGSMCDAMHFAEELSGRYRQDRKALAAQSISDPAHLTCVGNDWGFERVFARGVEAWGRPADTLIVFSTSGNSRNLIEAATSARTAGLTVLGLLGRDGGPLKGLCNLALVVPGTTSDRIQEVHIKVVHLTIEAIERELFPENYSSPASARVP
jgi:D-sedoheptulose 7-phosphate isomerase